MKWSSLEKSAKCVFDENDESGYGNFAGSWCGVG